MENSTRGMVEQEVVHGLGDTCFISALPFNIALVKFEVDHFIKKIP